MDESVPRGDTTPRAAAVDPFAYATARLSPTARRILEAAHRVLTRDGYEGLTLRRIAAEADETKSLILYHFESKAGLVATLVDSLWHDADVALVDGLCDRPDDITGHASQLIGLHRDLALQSSLYGTYFDLLPHILRDRDARTRLAQFYDSYRLMGLMCLEPSTLARTDLVPLTILLLGIGEGIAAQALLDPEETDIQEAFTLLDDMLRTSLGGQPGAAVSRLRDAFDWASSAPDAPDDDEPDPAADLSPVASNLLTAAQHVVHAKGLRALTLDSIAERAGEPRSSISYYFGDKRGLVDRIHAAELRETRALSRRAVRRLPAGAERVPAVMAAQEHMLARPTSYRRQYEMLPAVLRDDTLRARHVVHLRWLRDATATSLAGSDDPERVRRLRTLASLTLAGPSGVAIQRLVAPCDVDPTPVLDAWTRIAMSSLRAPGERT